MEVQKCLEGLSKCLGREVIIYSITLDPEKDTPAVLKKYAKSHGAKWTFLTGKPEDIKKLRRALGLANSDSKKDSDRKNHTALIQIRNESTGKKTAISVLAHPQRILDMIERVCPPTYPKE